MYNTHSSIPCGLTRPKDSFGPYSKSIGKDGKLVEMLLDCKGRLQHDPNLDNVNQHQIKLFEFFLGHPIASSLFFYRGKLGGKELKFFFWSHGGH